MFDTSRLDRSFGDKRTDELRDAVREVLQQHQFDLREPILLRNRGSGPVFKVRQYGAEQHRILDAQDADGRVVRLGFGLGSTGIVANELVPDVNFAIDAIFANEHIHNPNGPPSPGFNSSGIPNSSDSFVPVTDWARALTSVQKSNDTGHAPDSAVKLTRDGQKYWWVNEPWKWQAVHCTVTAINDDTLTCNVIANGNVTPETITVAKPCFLQRTPWDGQTEDGISYAYSDSQTRTATVASSPTTQVVYPAYKTSGICPCIFAIWAGNGTGVDGVQWLDVNTDARHWVDQ